MVADGGIHHEEGALEVDVVEGGHEHTLLSDDDVLHHVLDGLVEEVDQLDLAEVVQVALGVYLAELAHFVLEGHTHVHETHLLVLQAQSPDHHQNVGGVMGVVEEVVLGAALEFNLELWEVAVDALGVEVDLHLVHRAAGVEVDESEDVVTGEHSAEPVLEVLDLEHSGLFGLEGRHTDQGGQETLALLEETAVLSVHGEETVEQLLFGDQYILVGHWVAEGVGLQTVGHTGDDQDGEGGTLLVLQLAGLLADLADRHSLLSLGRYVQLELAALDHLVTHYLAHV